MNSIVKGSYTEKYRYGTSCKYINVWTPLLIRAVITSEWQPSRLWTDKGTEFHNQQLKTLTANNVMLYSTEDEEKSSVVERWNRTMKNIMWKYFTANSTQKYIDVLPNMVEKYNNTYHRSIKLTPSDARNQAKYQHALYAKFSAREATPPKFHVGDRVRITRKVRLRNDLQPH